MRNYRKNKTLHNLSFSEMSINQELEKEVFAVKWETQKTGVCQIVQRYVKGKRLVSLRFFDPDGGKVLGFSDEHEIKN